MQKQFTNTNMIYIMALFMALIPYGRSLDNAILFRYHWIEWCKL